MTQNLLYNKVNPAVVSKIVFFKGRRWRKPHPYFYNLHKKKYGIFAWRNQDDIFRSYFERPHVEMLGSDGSTISRIYCKSNKEALELLNQLEEKLDEWVASTKQKDN